MKLNWGIALAILIIIVFFAGIEFNKYKNRTAALNSLSQSLVLEDDPILTSRIVMDTSLWYLENQSLLSFWSNKKLINEFEKADDKGAFIEEFSAINNATSSLAAFAGGGCGRYLDNIGGLFNMIAWVDSELDWAAKHDYDDGSEYSGWGDIGEDGMTYLDYNPGLRMEYNQMRDQLLNEVDDQVRLWGNCIDGDGR